MRVWGSLLRCMIIGRCLMHDKQRAGQACLVGEAVVGMHVG
jgi:hypothetical protein